MGKNVHRIFLNFTLGVLYSIISFFLISQHYSGKIENNIIYIIFNGIEFLIYGEFFKLGKLFFKKYKINYFKSLLTSIVAGFFSLITTSVFLSIIWFLKRKSLVNLVRDVFSFSVVFCLVSFFVSIVNYRFFASSRIIRKKNIVIRISFNYFIGILYNIISFYFVSSVYSGTGFYGIWYTFFYSLAFVVYGELFYFFKSKLQKTQIDFITTFYITQLTGLILSLLVGSFLLILWIHAGISFNKILLLFFKIELTFFLASIMINIIYYRFELSEELTHSKGTKFKL